MNNGEKFEYYGRARASKGEALEVHTRTSMKGMSRMDVAVRPHAEIVAEGHGAAAALEAAAMEFRCVHCGRDTRVDCYCF
jgi:hypothetical protein